ncbi:amidohydrolase family protein [Isosphaeraceae bacterium EP7]
MRARAWDTGRWVEVEIDGSRIGRTRPADGPGSPDPADLWIGPAFWDLQTNGRWGISYSSPTITPDQVIEVVRALRHLGTARLCPTLITASAEHTLRGVRAIAEACRADPIVDAMVAGIHLEGPSISEIDGYRGAHPLSAIRDPDWAEFTELQQAADGRIRIVTLAPERSGSIEYIARANAAGVIVALGHTSADAATLWAAIAAGARLSTHLGNGIATPISRHPNPIWHQAAADALMASFIADGHHLDDSTLKVLIRAKTHRRSILVSDHSPLAGLPAGVYGDWEVHPSGKILVAGTPYLAGSNQDLDQGINTLMRAAGCGLAEALTTATLNPANLLGAGETPMAPGSRANLIAFRLDQGGPFPTFRLVSTCVDGHWIEADPAIRQTPEVVSAG